MRPELSEEEIATYLDQWLQENPLNLNRPADLAFTQALTDRCQQLQQTEEKQESTINTPPVENGDGNQPKEIQEKEPTSTSGSKANKAALLGDTIVAILPWTIGEAAPSVIATEPKPINDSEEPLDEPTEETSKTEPTISFPRLTGTLSVSIVDQKIFAATSPENKYNDLFTDTILSANFFVTKELYFNTAWRFLPAVFPPSHKRDRAFEDQTLRLGALGITYENNQFYVTAGKGTTFFSTAFRAAPGIWGRDVAERDIRVPVRIGIAAAGKFDGGAAGNHALSGGAFFLDTSVLNEPFFTGFGRPRLENGGPSNTESLESFFVVLDSTNFKALPGLRTHLGFMRQKVDRLKPPSSPMRLPDELIDDEYRFVVAAQWPIKVSEDITVTPLVEYARLWNASGLNDQNRDYVTTALQLFKGPWNVALASTVWLIDKPMGTDSTNVQFQISGGYLFDVGLGVDVGYRYLDVADLELKNTHSVGIWLRYVFGF